MGSSANINLLCFEEMPEISESEFRGFINHLSSRRAAVSIYDANFQRWNVLKSMYNDRLFPEDYLRLVCPKRLVVNKFLFKHRDGVPQDFYGVETLVGYDKCYVCKPLIPIGCANERVDNFIEIESTLEVLEFMSNTLNYCSMCYHPLFIIINENYD